MNNDQVQSPQDEAQEVLVETTVNPTVQPEGTEGAESIDLTTGGRSFKDVEELKKSYAALQSDYTRKAQKLSEIEKSVSPDTGNTQNISGQESSYPNDEVQKAVSVLRANGVPTMEDIVRINTVRDFVSDKNAHSSYDDLRVTPEEQSLIEQRLKMGISPEETYTALKSSALLKHATEEAKKYEPTQLNTAQGSRVPQPDQSVSYVKEEDIKKARKESGAQSGYVPVPEVMNAIDNIVDSALNLSEGAPIDFSFRG